MSGEEAKGKFYIGMLLPSELLKPRSAEACVLRHPVLVAGGASGASPPAGSSPPFGMA